MTLTPKLKIVILTLLFVLPIVFIGVMGMYHLWVTGLAFWTWWPMGACFALGMFFAWRWQKNLITQANEPIPVHWTARDSQAWEMIEERAKKIDEINQDNLGEPQFYFATAQELAKQLAGHYQPNASDPIGPVTVPEVLAVIELATQDLNAMVRTYIPGSHLLTIDNWRTARKAVGWYKTVNKVYWAASFLWDPVKTATRFAASQYGIGGLQSAVQANATVWFYGVFIKRVGFYLIELYSGRLKVGAKRYREIFAEHSAGMPDSAKGPQLDANATIEPEVGTTPTPNLPVPPAAPSAIRIAVIGQVKAGKSSLINALLHDQQAAVDVVPLTQKATEYRLLRPESKDSVTLFDTAGYGGTAAELPGADTIEQTGELIETCDLVLWVTHARNPAREVDREFLGRLSRWFAEHKHLKMPPILGVMTHVDLLSPAMEWKPPYQWLNPQTAKEKSIAEALGVVRDVYPGTRMVVPSCVQQGKVWNIDEGVFPLILQQLDEAKAVRLIRTLHGEFDEGKVKRVFQQVWATGKTLLGLLGEKALK